MCLRTVFGLSQVDFIISPNDSLGSLTRVSIIQKSMIETGGRLLRGVKARPNGLTPVILARLSIASCSFLVHSLKVIPPSSFQATHDTSATASALSTVLRGKSP